MGAVIDAASFDTQKEAIEEAKADAKSEVVVGGGYDDSEGYFVEPTVIRTEDPDTASSGRALRPGRHDLRLPGRELGGDARADRPHGSIRADGAIFAGEREAVMEASDVLRYGRESINDKPTGAVVGQQPFGGAGVGDERQGELAMEPDPLGEPADDQGDPPPAEGLPIRTAPDGGWPLDQLRQGDHRLPPVRREEERVDHREARVAPELRGERLVADDREVASSMARWNVSATTAPPRLAACRCPARPRAGRRTRAACAGTRRAAPSSIRRARRRRRS